jgi:hypothetical protein
MWLITQHGFFSIVANSYNPNEGSHQIRTRCEADAHTLKAMAALAGEVVETPQADYPFRIVVRQEELTNVFALLSKAIDYDNFKARVDASPTQRHKSPFYHKVWAILNQLPPR